MNDPLELLALTPIFGGLDADELAPLQPAIRTRRFDRGAYLFREGDPGSHLYVVVKGEVRISRVEAGGGEVVFGILGDGDVLGELSLFETQGERTADACALVRTECLVIPRAPVIEFLSAHPALLVQTIARLGAYIRQKDDAIGEIAFLDIPARVALKLLELAAGRGRPTSGGTVIDMPLSQRTLAAMVGASRENVNRALSRFAELGYIRQAQGSIELLNIEQLRRRGSSRL